MKNLSRSARIADMSRSLQTRLTTSKPFTWLLKNFASRCDPVIFKATNGRFTFFGPTVFPMVTLTIRGRKTGKPRAVHLAAIEFEGSLLVVANSMGSARHPGWCYNVEENPDIDVQAEGESYRAMAQRLNEEEKNAGRGRLYWKQSPKLRFIRPGQTGLFAYFACCALRE